MLIEPAVQNLNTREIEMGAAPLDGPHSKWEENDTMRGTLHVGPYYA